MADPQFRRRSVLFLFVLATVTLVLLLLPLVETVVWQYVLTRFGLLIGPDGNLIAEGGAAPGMVAHTTYDLASNVLHILKIILWMAVVIAVVRYVGYLVFTTVLRADKSEIATLMRTVLSIIIYIVAFFIIFQSQYPGVQLAPLFTGSTIIGIVVGLALQDTLGNLFAGIAMQADQPFQVGDVIAISNRGTGVVEAVSWRGVKIRTFQNKLLIISNAVLGKETIEVAPRDNLNARLVFFNTLYSNSPSKTAQVVREVVRHVDNVSSKIRPIVRIRNLGDNGIDWEIKYWLDDYKRYNDTDSQIRQRVWYVFQRENINFAYPTRTIHVEKKTEPVPEEDVVSSVSEQLSRVPVFAPLSEEEISKLARASVRRVFAPGEPIVRKGQEGRSMFVIVRGNVRVELPGKQGPVVINRLTANDFFGEMSLLTGAPRSATVVTDDEVEVLEIRKRALQPIFDANPELMEAVTAIIEERKELLQKETDIHVSEKPDRSKGVLSSIRKFFGID